MSKREKKNRRSPVKKEYRTFAEGFAAAAEREQRKHDLHAEIAKTMRGEKSEPRP